MMKIKHGAMAFLGCAIALAGCGSGGSESIERALAVTAPNGAELGGQNWTQLMHVVDCAALNIEGVTNGQPGMNGQPTPGYAEGAEGATRVCQSGVLLFTLFNDGRFSVSDGATGNIEQNELEQVNQMLTELSSEDLRAQFTCEQAEVGVQEQGQQMMFLTLNDARQVTLFADRHQMGQQCTILSRDRVSTLRQQLIPIVERYAAQSGVEQPAETPEQPANGEQPVETPEQPANGEQPVETPEQPANGEQPAENANNNNAAPGETVNGTEDLEGLGQQPGGQPGQQKLPREQKQPGQQQQVPPGETWQQPGQQQQLGQPWQQPGR
jgi:hypothetical protein